MNSVLTLSYLQVAWDPATYCPPPPLQTQSQVVGPQMTHPLCDVAMRQRFPRPPNGCRELARVFTRLLRNGGGGADRGQRWAAHRGAHRARAGRPRSQEPPSPWSGERHPPGTWMCVRQPGGSLNPTPWGVWGAPSRLRDQLLTPLPAPLPSLRRWGGG